MNKQRLKSYLICGLSFLILASCDNSVASSESESSSSQGGASSSNTDSSSSESSSSSSKGDEDNDLTMTVGATEDKINIDITGGSKLSSKSLKVIGMPAYQYLEGDEIQGLSASIVALKDANVVATYQSESNSSVSINRESTRNEDVYDQTTDEFVSKDIDFDNIYNKYYVTNDKEILLGPIYCTDIDPIITDEPSLTIKSKKGAFGENAEDFKDLGCSYATINFDISQFIKPNEYYTDGFNGDLVGRDHADNEVQFVSNGKTFYFDSYMVDYYDQQILSYYSQGASVTAIILANPVTDFMGQFPSSLTYEYANQETTIMGLNTSNVLGFEYYVALIEFLADRYGSNAYEKGYINNFIIGNEIDYARDYNRISEKQATLDVYMEEYSRLLRLTDLAARKYQKDIKVAMPLTHNWSEPGYTSSNNGVAAYAPKDLVDWLNRRSKATGDFNWGIAPHAYGAHLTQTYVFGIDTSYDYRGIGMTGGRGYGETNNINTTKLITFSNIEILDAYLNSAAMKANGKGRKMYLTECGISTCFSTEKEEKAQAGYIAACYYKLSQLPSVVSWDYYRLVDNETETKAYTLFGLIDEKGNKKPSYEVYKYIDTQYGEYIANKYLSTLEYFDESNVEHSIAKGNVSSFNDFLDVFNTGYDFSGFSWSKSSPRTIDTIYEFEDKEDLGDLAFLSQNFLYDGTPKSLSVMNLGNGLTVEYDGNNGKIDVGSYDVIATIKRDGTVVGRRKATLTIYSHLSTDKTEFAYGEDIVINTKSSDTNSKDWIGIFNYDANIGNSTKIYDTSFYYYYPNKGDGYIRSDLLQQDAYWNHPNTESKTLAPGRYKIAYLENDGYNVLESIDITILGSSETSKYPNLSGISFSDSSKALNDSTKSVSLEVDGTLPAGVSISYKNNTLSSAGKTNAEAIFSLNGSEIARRYAVLEAYVEDEGNNLKTDKTEYNAGESIMVTARGSATGQWVGIYLSTDTVSTDLSIYWYYVSEHQNAVVDIKKTSFNAKRAAYSDLPAGEYKIVLFADSGYTVKETINITIVGEAASRLSTDKTTYTLGESIYVTLNVKSDLDWVGLFSADASSYGDSALLQYYSPKSLGNVSINNRKTDITKEGAMNWTPAVGSYKIVAFADGGYTLNYEEVTITIVEANVE